MRKRHKASKKNKIINVKLVDYKTNWRVENQTEIKVKLDGIVVQHFTFLCAMWA
jgi:hypothetical protein